MFDQSSGQVFKEWTLPRHALATRQPDHDWSRRCPYPRFIPKGTRGPRSLVDMVTSVVADNVGSVTEAHLEVMPPRLRWRVWRFLEARGLCFHAWKLFSRPLLHDTEEDKTLGLYRYRQHICKPSHPLRFYTQPLISQNTSFITHLVISGGCQFQTSEMLCLAEMPNLGVLEIIQPADDLHSSGFPEISDRLVRGWAEMDNDGTTEPFPMLRVLRIWGDECVSQDSLRWISRFPSLALYDVTSLREDWTRPHEFAQEHGWEAITEAASRLEDSLLRYLLLLAPPTDDTAHQLQRSRDLARSIDADLVGLCGDSRCALRFVEYGSAPDLLAYLTDVNKVQHDAGKTWWDKDAAAREAGSCRGVAFEAWAFWLYSLMGQISQDRDMRRKEQDDEEGKGRPESQAVVGPFVLPSKPMACLFLGHSGRGGISSKPAYVTRGLFATKRYTFTRASILRPEEEMAVHAEHKVRAHAEEKADVGVPEAPVEVHMEDAPREPRAGRVDEPAPQKAMPQSHPQLHQEQQGQRKSGPRRQKRKRLDDMLSSLMGAARKTNK